MTDRLGSWAQKLQHLLMQLVFLTTQMGVTELGHGTQNQIVTGQSHHPSSVWSQLGLRPQEWMKSSLVSHAF